MFRVWLMGLAVSLVGAAPGLAEQQRKPVDRLPADVVAAWEKAGARAGWLGLDNLGYLNFRLGEAGHEGELPAFIFEWRPGVLGLLPQPERGFGLCLMKVTDEGLKELAGLKFLQALNLDETNMTDVRLKELVRLKSLRALSLYWTPVTDAGLKELAELKSLQTLNLDLTKVTDAGLPNFAY